MSLTEAETVAILNQGILIFGVLGILLILVRLLYLVFKYKMARWPQPRLLRRDIVLFLGLVIPFLAIFVRRAFNIQGLTDNFWWNLFTGLPAVIAIYYWLWDEMLVVGRKEDPPKRDKD